MNIIFRFLIGLLLIFSGLIKMNDPKGFSYKMEEFFSPDVFNLVFLNDYSLSLAVFIISFEIFLGVALIIGYKKKHTLLALTGLILFFTFLTFYAAYFDKVKSCGCFGDFIKLTPWQSFAKDLFFLVFCVYFLLKINRYKPLFNSIVRFWIMSFTVVFCLMANGFVISTLPIFDFRPYKVGNNIKDLRNIPEDAPKPKIEYRWKFKMPNGNIENIVTDGTYPELDGAKLIKVDTEMVDMGYQPLISDFVLIKDDIDYSEELLSYDNLIMIISEDFDALDEEKKQKLYAFINEINNKYDTLLIMVSTMMVRDNRFKDVYFYLSDAIEIKTMIRANPGFMYLKKGTIVSKNHINNLDRLINIIH